MKLISAGKVLENSKTIAQCRSPFDEIPAGIITMHVVVQQSSSKIKTGELDFRASSLHICENVMVLSGFMEQ